MKPVRTQPKFLETLDRALVERHVAEGYRLLDQAEGDLAALRPEDAHAAELLLLVAQWVDVGYRDHRLLDALMLRFTPETQRRLPFHSYLRLRLVDGFRALSSGRVDDAIDTLEFVLRAEREAPEISVVALAHFWKGRAHRKKGEYEAALADISQARELAQRLTAQSTFSAVIQIQESWLLFQKGMRKEAWRMLAHAESVLKGTDHYVALGNIESARGRIVRRAGEYAKALEHFDRAIAIYTAGDPNHPNLARTLVNSAYVKRLLALQLHKKLDSSRRRDDDEDGRGRSASAESWSMLRQKYQRTCQEALAQLRRAKEIYELHEHAIGVGSVLFNAGYLHLEQGDIDRAGQEAVDAYRIGVEKSDHILMARARILEAAVENARVEEQVGEDVDAALHANHAKQYSEEALELARHTQNTRLLAGAWLARGMTAANDFFQDWETAKRCASEASGATGSGENDHLVDELASLKAHITRASGISDTLRSWSEGMIGDKTFQQVTEEFAELVIPKVWMREGRKISKVAEKLSISPKKVRRILRNAGFLGS
jgi:tetratricopeptide (TPR) repeat protein